MKYLKDPVFWGGAAIGFFVGPMAAKILRVQLSRLRAAGSAG
jgi:hypothetical protein